MRRVQAATTRPLKLDPVRPEYHRATLHWRAGANETAGARVTPAAYATLTLRLFIYNNSTPKSKTRRAGLHCLLRVRLHAPAALPQHPFIRCSVAAQAGTWVAESTGGQLSSRLLSMRSASALLELPKVGTRHQMVSTTVGTWHQLVSTTCTERFLFLSLLTAATPTFGRV